jgi:hypothetical protein
MKMKTVIRSLALAGLLIATGCGGLGDRFYDYETPTPPDMDVLMLAQCLIGSFSSAEQAAGNPEYRDITLETVRIWPLNDDGVWLYVEQAAADSKDKPYRQRVYHLTRRNELVFSSEIYLLPDEAAMAGAWRDPARFDALTPENLSVKEGCAVELERVNEWTFAGSTREQECPSELEGASYATSEVTITPSWLESWDRGFDEEGNQVWGATGGPYRFVKLSR